MVGGFLIDNCSGGVETPHRLDLIGTGTGVTKMVRSEQSGNVLLKIQEVLVNGYKASLELKEDCLNCILVLKQVFIPIGR